MDDSAYNPHDDSSTAKPAQLPDRPPWLSFAVGVAEPFKKSYDGIKQIAEKIDLALPVWDMTQASVGSTSGKLGAALGSLAEFWLINRAAGKVTGAGRLTALSTTRGEALKMGITGGALGLLEPVENDRNFGWAKAVSIVEGASSMSVFGAATGFQARWAVMGRPGYRSFLGEALTNSAAGAVSGIVGAEVHSLGLHGKAADWVELRGQVATNAALGFGLAGADRLVFGRNKIALRMADGSLPKPAITTEDWVQNSYDGKTEIRSPILTWLAEFRRDLRPDNYEQLRARAWAETNGVNLNLSDWSSAQRPAVISALRRLAKTDLASDANIDAFISQMNSPAINSALPEFAAVNKPSFDFEEQIRAAIAKSPELTSIGDLNVRNWPDLLPPGHVELVALIEEANKARRLVWETGRTNRLEPLLQEQFARLSGETGLPVARVSASYGSQNGLHIQDFLGFGMGRATSMSAFVVERTLHEFEHHRQGPISGIESVIYLLKYPYYLLRQKLGFIDQLPMKQTGGSAHEYFTNYVGSSTEKAAYATGLLARIRALAQGLPEGD